MSRPRGMLDRMRLRWLTVFLDFPAGGFAAGVAFWQAVTGCGLSSFRGPTADFATLLPRPGDAYLRVQRVLSGAGGCHLDLHTDSLGEAAAFWSALTGAEARPAPVPGFTYLKGPAGMPVRLLLQRLDDAAPGQPARAHVDLGCTDPAGEVARHVRLGARVTAAFPRWTVLTDPAGREYCLLNRPPRGTMRG